MAHSFLNDTLDLLLTLLDIAVDELTLSSGLRVGGYGDRLGIPVTRIAVRCDVRDVMLGEIVSKVLHGLLVVRHKDIDVEPVFGELFVDGHRKAAAEAAGDGNGDHSQIAVRCYDLLSYTISDIVGNSKGHPRQDAFPVLDQDRLRSAKRIVQDLREEKDP